MKRILIADSSKASLVMTSEVFKDNYPGVQVIVARSGEDVLKLAHEFNDIDAFIIDFDLPTTNGALVAAELKKSFKSPILITAFDRQDVHHTIETLLGKYEDCKSWLKKPIHPEVVIAVAQRYCEGKIRLQKRIPCRIPALTHLTYKTKPRAKESTLTFCAVIEDCSINGVKLSPYQHPDARLTNWSQLLSHIEFINKDNKVTLHIPRPSDIEESKHLSIDQLLRDSLPAEALPPPTPLVVANTTKTKKTTSKSTAAKSTASKSATSKNTAAKQQPTQGMQILEGKIAWTSTESGDWSLGIEFEDITLAKRLFEATVVGQHKKSPLYHLRDRGSSQSKG